MKYSILLVILLLSGCAFLQENPFGGIDYNEMAEGSCDGTNAEEVEIKLEKNKARIKCNKDNNDTFKVLVP